MNLILQDQLPSDEYLDWHEEGGKVHVSVHFSAPGQSVKSILISEARADYLNGLGSTIARIRCDDWRLVVQIKRISQSEMTLTELNLREKFLLSQLFGLSFQGMVQRGNLYLKDASPADREAWRKKLEAAVMDLPIEGMPAMADEAYLDLLNGLQSKVNAWKEFDDLLAEGGWRAGSVQKLVNLWLKYLWCAGFLKSPPPHFPVDRIMLQYIPGMKDVSWTKMENWRLEDEIDGALSYMRIIHAARVESAGEPLALWELRKWQPHSNSKRLF